MSDFEKSDALLALVWKLTDPQMSILLEYVSNYLYGDKEFNTAVENALEKMKVKTEERRN